MGARVGCRQLTSAPDSESDDVARRVALAGHRGDTDLARRHLTHPDRRVRTIALRALHRAGDLRAAEWTAATTDAEPAVRGQRPQRVADGRDHGAGQAEERIVQHEQPRPRHESPRDRDHLLLASREQTGRLVPALAQHREERLEARACRRRLPAGRPQVGAEVQVLGHGQLVEEPAAFRDRRHAESGDPVRRQARDRDAVETDGPRPEG